MYGFFFTDHIDQVIQELLFIPERCKSILSAKSRVYIDVLIVSEFVNGYARLKHNLLRGRPGVPNDFKRFRATPAFKAIA